MQIHLGPFPSTRARCQLGAFFFFILKKNKISKIYVRFEKFQKYTPVALWGTCPKYNFFSSNLQRGPWPGARGWKGGLSPPIGRPGAPHTGATGGGLSPPLGRPALPLLYKHSTLIPSSFEPKNSTKNPEKKRGVRRREAAKPCRIAHLWSAGKYF